MKKIVVFAMAFTLLLGMESCEKTNSIETTVSPEYALDPTLTVGLSGKLYRATTDRPRDGKNCGCKVCFGVCELGIKIGVGLSGIALDPNTGNGKGRIYLLGNHSHAESEFGIDQDLTVPLESLEGTGIVDLTILSGEYNYIEQVGTILVDGASANYYGYVDVDVI